MSNIGDRPFLVVEMLPCLAVEALYVVFSLLLFVDLGADTPTVPFT